MKTVIVIPTYNEKENISRLIPEIFAEQSNTVHDLYILVVDDNSPDQTADVVREWIEKDSRVSLITGKKEGLGKAYIRGMRYALDHLKAEVIVEMDADFSHKPEDLPRLLKELDEHDFVIGSRYVPGGKIPQEWSLLRKMNSKFGNIAARYIAGITSIKDCTAGFRAIGAHVLEEVDLSQITSDGYCFQVVLLHRAITHGARLKEIPVEFIDRTVGVSKLGFSDIIEFLFYVWLIRLEGSKTFIKFCLVGFSGLVVNLGALTILMSAGMNKFIASPISIEISILTNFALNNYWTFAQRDNHSRTRIKGLKFNVVSLLALGISYTCFVFLSLLYPRIPAQLAQAIGIIPATIVNYFLNSYWTFRSSDEVEKL